MHDDCRRDVGKFSQFRNLLAPGTVLRLLEMVRTHSLGSARSSSGRAASQFPQRHRRILVAGGKGGGCCPTVTRSRGILHRDLKPENVLVGKEPAEGDAAAPRIKLADFGISLLLDEGEPSEPAPAQPAPMPMPTSIDGSEPSERIAFEPTLWPSSSSDPKLTGTGVIMGTPPYIAPELVHGSRNAQPASDVFSFGVLAFEVLTGRQPFEKPAIELCAGGLPIEIPDALRSRGLDDAALPVEIAALIERCLSPDPGARPTAADLAAFC